MKKWLTGFCILLLLSIASIYILIPADLTVSEAAVMQCNVNSANKFLGDGRQWDRWWPGNAHSPAADTTLSGSGRFVSRFEYGGMGYSMPGVYRHLMEIHILTPDSVIHSRAGVIGAADNLDSTVIQWECHLDAGWNPIGRIRAYKQGERIKANMTGIFSALRTFLEDKQKIYGINIQEVTTTDSFLLATRATFPVRPTTTDVAALMQKLRGVIAAGNARETGHPMVNISPAPQRQFEVMAAIPINKELRPGENFYSRKLVQGKYLMTEVRGGEYTVGKALDALQQYMQDYQRTTMAIPFQSWITDRGVEKDTAKWVTRLYYPVY